MIIVCISQDKKPRPLVGNCVDFDLLKIGRDKAVLL